MANMNVKKGDAVVVISGAEKGKSGVILATSPSTGRVLVEGVNMATKSLKARRAGEKSGFVQKEAPIDASNVMIVCPSCGKATRVRHDMVEVDGKQKKGRICVKCGASLEAKPAKKKTTARRARRQKAAE